MAKFDRLVISGEQQPNIDASIIARVIIMLARLRLRKVSKERASTNEGATS